MSKLNKIINKLPISGIKEYSKDLYKEYSDYIALNSICAMASAQMNLE